ncbi:hypothetical protein BJV78DRAFT_822260 [Lactifluus subvellereus]|nr:hypothetical protein BJV78DRAFT_822260 [Lactifluus subvellereus]
MCHPSDMDPYHTSISGSCMLALWNVSVGSTGGLFSIIRRLGNLNAVSRVPPTGQTRSYSIASQGKSISFYARTVRWSHNTIDSRIQSGRITHLLAGCILVTRDFTGGLIWQRRRRLKRDLHLTLQVLVQSLRLTRHPAKTPQYHKLQPVRAVTHSFNGFSITRFGTHLGSRRAFWSDLVLRNAAAREETVSDVPSDDLSPATSTSKRDSTATQVGRGDGSSSALRAGTSGNSSEFFFSPQDGTYLHSASHMNPRT